MIHNGEPDNGLLTIDNGKRHIATERVLIHWEPAVLLCSTTTIRIHNQTCTCHNDLSVTSGQIQVKQLNVPEPQDLEETTCGERNGTGWPEPET